MSASRWAAWGRASFRRDSSTPQGNPGIVPLAPAIEGIENIAFNDFTIGVNITGVVQANNTYQWTDNFSKVAGRHLLKFGANVHFNQINIAPNATYNGTFMFQGTETGSDFRGLSVGHRQRLCAGRFETLLSAQPVHRPVRPGPLADSLGSDAELRPALGRAAAVEREVQPVADGGSRTAVGGLSGCAEGPCVSRRSGHPVDACADPVQELRAAHRTRLGPVARMAAFSASSSVRSRRPVSAPGTASTTRRSRVSRPAS